MVTTQNRRALPTSDGSFEILRPLEQIAVRLNHAEHVGTRDGMNFAPGDAKADLLLINGNQLAGNLLIAWKKQLVPWPTAGQGRGMLGKPHELKLRQGK